MNLRRLRHREKMAHTAKPIRKDMISLVIASVLCAVNDNGWPFPTRVRSEDAWTYRMQRGVSCLRP